MSLITPLSLLNQTSSLSKTSSLDPNALGMTGTTDPNATTTSFGQTLENAFGKVNDMQNNANDLAKSFALGQTSDIHGVMIASQQATIALQLTTQIRNKAIDAYQEVMKMSM